MKINVVCVGKLKEPYWTAACAEYLKRLSRFAAISVAEVPDENVRDEAGRINAAVKKEGERVLPLLEGAFCAALCVDGDKMTSENFGAFLKEKTAKAEKDLAFVVGGSYGLSDEVIKRANLKLSFSEFTFPHQLMRVILLEQIFRGFKIARGEVYHK
jgi:23S rRNA (pseudouridine1915-N3)-methyltransferase